MSFSTPSVSCAFSEKKLCVFQLGLPMEIPFSKQLAVKSDSVKFGMERNPNAGCCVTRFTGGQSGCCSAIKSGKPFEKAYIEAVEKSIAKEGKMPDLAPKVIKKLEELDELKRLQELAKLTAAERVKNSPDSIEKTQHEKSKVIETPKEPLWKRILLTPFRFFKWLFSSIFKDAKFMKNKLTGSMEEAA